MAMKKRLLLFVSIMLFAAMLAACGAGKTSAIKYHFADREEAVSCFLSNEDYFNEYRVCH